MPVVAYDFSRFPCVVVEDSSFMRLLLTSCMHALGVQRLRSFDSGSEAIEFLRAVKKEPMRAGVNSVECVITDLEMAPVDGLMLLRWIRKSSESLNKFMPVIMVTAHSDAQRVCEARDAGVTEFLTKPFSVHALASKIAHVVEHPRQFVQTGTYFGPDRRRQTREIAFPDRRVLTDRSPNVEVVYG